MALTYYHAQPTFLACLLQRAAVVTSVRTQDYRVAYLALPPTSAYSLRRIR